MTTNPPLVYGESLFDLLPGLIRFRRAMRLGSDGMYHSSVRLAPEEGAPLARALKRVEAELLLEETDAWPAGEPERTTSQRRADALLRLVTSLPSPPVAPTSERPRHGR